jgi:hypothetical protein
VLLLIWFAAIAVLTSRIGPYVLSACVFAVLLVFLAAYVKAAVMVVVVVITLVQNAIK